MPNTSIPATGEAMPEISKIILGSVHATATHTLEANSLRGLPMDDLQALMDLLVALDDLTCAFLNQPRYSDNGNARNPFNHAGQLGDSIGTHLSQCIALVEQAAKDARPSTKKDAEDRAWLLLQRAAHYSDDLSQFVAAAAQLSVEASSVEGA